MDFLYMEMFCGLSVYGDVLWTFCIWRCFVDFLYMEMFCRLSVYGDRFVDFLYMEMDLQTFCIRRWICRLSVYGDVLQTFCIWRCFIGFLYMEMFY